MKANRTIESFFDENPIDCYLFFNGTYDFWHSMPVMNREQKNKNYFLRVQFETKDEILEFYKLIKYKEIWGSTAFPIPKNSISFKIRFPGNILDRKRNTNYRFVHQDTALANPDLYEIVPLEVLHYGEK